MRKTLLFIIVFRLIIVSQAESADFPVSLYGFVEYDIGSRVVENEYYADDVVLNEAVFRVELATDSDSAALNVKTDVRWDEFLNKADITVREAHITLFPDDWWEAKIGRQVLQWGTGERMFVNDLFPKDWKSWYIGRDDEFLNAPVNAAKVDLVTEFGDVTAVMVPKFTPDTHIDGERLSYWQMNAFTNHDSGVEFPEYTLANAEYHFRFTKNLIYKVVEVTLYGYKGFFKQLQEQESKFFPKLAVYGFSIRVPSPVAVFYIESGYYDSLEDRDGTDPLIANSMMKSLAGCKLTIIKNFTATLQYGFEWMQAYDDYRESLQSKELVALKEEYRDWITLHVIRLDRREKLLLSLFSAYSPAEKDWFTRPDITYRISGPVRLTVGANLFFGDQKHTTFGQYQENSNVFFRVRYTF